MNPKVEDFLKELVSNEGLGVLAAAEIKERARALINLNDHDRSSRDMKDLFKYQ